MLKASQWEILERIASGASLPEVLEQIVRMVELQAEGMVCSVLLLDRQQQCLRHGAAPSLPIPFATAIDGALIGPNAGSCGAAAFRRERVIVRDISTHPFWTDYKDLALPHGLLACWSTPIFSPGREVLGTFAMYYRQIREPSPDEFDWVNAATHLAAIAIGRDRTEKLLRQSEARARSLADLYAVANSVNDSIVRSLKPQELYQLACRIAVEKGLLRLAWVGITDNTEGTVKPVARFGADDGFVDRIALHLRDGQPENGPVGEAFRTGGPAVANHIQGDMSYRWRDESIQRGLHSCAAFPIKLGSITIGAIALYADRPGFFTEDELRVLNSLAANLSIAVQSAGAEAERQRLVHDLGERIKELTLLHRAARLLQSDQPFDRELISELISFLPLGWQYPEVCEAHIAWDKFDVRTPGWRETPWSQSAPFQARGRLGLIQVAYIAERPAAAEGPFLQEERRVLDSLADMLGSHLERQLASAAMRESEERLRAVVEYTPNVAVQWYDTEGSILFWNRASTALFGWTDAEAIGKTLADLIFSPEEHEKFLDLLKEVQRTGRPSGPLEFSFHRRDSTEGFCLSTVFEIQASGQKKCVVCMDVDLTERKRAEDALRKSLDELREANQRVQLHVSHMPMAYVVWEGNLLVSEWNPAAERIFGWTASEAIGRSLFDLIVPENALAHVKRVWADLIEGGDWSAHSINENVRKDGTRLVFEWFNAPLRDATGRVVGCISMGTDITERKKAEGERVRLESQLRQAQRMQSLGTLAGGVAHDFNNILVAITGNAALALLDTGAGTAARDCLQQIQQAGERARDLVRRILTFSRNQEPQRKRIRLQDIVKEALALLRSALPARIDIACHFEEGLPKISADATQIHQIIMNLGANAAHALGDRGGRIEVRMDSILLDGGRTSVSAELKTGRYVRLTFCDNGCGMELDTMERIFEPFFTTKDPGQGTGLGLSVVHGIVKGHGGAITVSSCPGQGSTFELYFAADDAAETEFVARPNQPCPGCGERILYVDDEEPLVYLASRFLNRLGYQVTGFTSSPQALRAYRENPTAFDAVVADLSMPVLSGAQFAHEIRAIRPDAAIVITSGYIRAEDVQAVRDLGILDFVLKPDKIDELAEILHRLFAEKRSNQPKKEMPHQTDK